MNRIADAVDTGKTPLHRRMSNRVLDSLLLYYHNREEQSEPELLLVILDDAELPPNELPDEAAEVREIKAPTGTMN